MQEIIVNKPVLTPEQKKQRKIKRITRRVVFDLLTCLIASAIISVSLYYFSNYNSFAPGGLTGIASILGNITSRFFKGDNTLNMSIFLIVLNLPIFIAVAIKVERRVGIMLTVYLLLQSVFLIILKKTNFLPYYDAYDYQIGNSLIFASVGVGVLTGFGFGLMVKRFGASGGTFAISALIKKRKPGINIAWLTFAMDISVVALSAFVYNFDTERVTRVNSVMGTIINIFVADLVVDLMLQGSKSGYKFEIITDDADALAEELMKTLGRGVTTLTATGMYTRTGKTMLVCVVRRRQIGEFLKIIKKYPNSFAYSCSIKEVYGRFREHPKFYDRVIKNTDNSQNNGDTITNEQNENK